MTGVCVEGWNIESNTKLHNVDCRFVYLLEYPKPGTDDRERRPSSGEFKPGEFTKLFEEVLTTVDLIFDQGIHWKAFIITFDKIRTELLEEEGAEIAVQAIENKGDGVFVVRVSVPTDANKKKIHSELIQNYELALKAIEQKDAELEAKDREIIQLNREKYTDMKEIAWRLAKSQHTVNIKAIATSESKSMSEASKYDQRGVQFAGGFADTSLADDQGAKRLLYEDLQVKEYWILDVQNVRIIAFAIESGGSRRITESQVLPGLSISMLEEVLRRTRTMDQSQVGSWLLTQFQQ